MSTASVKQWLCGSTEALKTKALPSFKGLDRASDYGSEGYRFESCRGHSKSTYDESCRCFFVIFRLV